MSVLPSYPDTEELTAKAAVSYLIEHIEYHDSYGVEGSGFMACLLCRGGGAPGISLVHEETCPVKRCEKIAAEWVDELNADREDCCPPAQGSQEGTPSAAGVWFSSLIESLRPFAYYFDLNDCEGRSDGDALEIPVSDLRAARDLLKKLGIDTSLPPWAPSLPSTNGATP